MTAHPHPVPEDQVQYSSLSSPATSTSTSSEPEDKSSDVTTSDDTLSTSGDSPTTSTTSDRQLRPRYPINYEKLLSKLHGIPQIRTFNNISILLPATDTESEEEESIEHSDTM